ncbi:MAG: hypothetical protein A2270_09745 [Elusimicrobia bacterium RIFOXYA12_FULL_51_18]|nr:MAG: hypothetical protein A2270_09745 [Elusimicrobia bacterium RIFOXYA12_FULL_51_18]OGS32784.1 MAG: hypothetical protein A2218_12060 [Elusimicrobia bacterium RIFOXYA2_FULL_53_38]
MAKIILALAVLLWLPAASQADWWMENDYSIGSNKFQKESLTLFSKLSPRIVGGVNASFYKDNGFYGGKVYAFRTPVMYSVNNLALSFKPFLYPEASGTGSSARGAKAYALFPVSESSDESYIHLMLSAAAARQKTPLNLTGQPYSPSATVLTDTAFSESAFEVQVEKSYFNQFFFLASAAGFQKPGKAFNSNLVSPVLDHGELAYLGTFRHVTALPEWVVAAQLARNMAPDFDSYLYAGFSRISFRGTNDASSLLGGIKMKLYEKSTLDFAYNFYKFNGEPGKNYYKLLIQVYF